MTDVIFTLCPKYGVYCFNFYWFSPSGFEGGSSNGKLTYIFDSISNDLIQPIDVISHRLFTQDDYINNTYPVQEHCQDRRTFAFAIGCSDYRLPGDTIILVSQRYDWNNTIIADNSKCLSILCIKQDTYNTTILEESCDAVIYPTFDMLCSNPNATKPSVVVSLLIFLKIFIAISCLIEVLLAITIHLTDNVHQFTQTGHHVSFVGNISTIWINLWRRDQNALVSNYR